MTDLQKILLLSLKRHLIQQSLRVICITASIWIQASLAQDQEWPSYGGDLANTRYSPLDIVNRDNFNDLELAWEFDTSNFGPEPEYRFQSTPLMVNRTLYSTMGSRRLADFALV